MKLKFLAPVLLLGALTALHAEDPSGALKWSAADFKQLSKTLSTKQDENHVGLQTLFNKGNFNALVFHREGTGPAELHEGFADVFVVQSGEGDVIVGGKAPGLKSTAPGELRGGNVEGGTHYKLRAGDVLYIPVNTPHQTVMASGKIMDALVVKIATK